MTDLKRDIMEAAGTWRDTLKYFGADRVILPHEHMTLGRAIQQYGKEAVIMALMGVRGQERSDRYNPAQYLSLNKVFDPRGFERFLNLGAQMTNARKKFDPPKDAQPEEPPADPEKVRSILAAAGFRSMPKVRTDEQE